MDAFVRLRDDGPDTQQGLRLGRPAAVVGFGRDIGPRACRVEMEVEVEVEVQDKVERVE
ncbi:hypothetical protein [Streptomyces phaeolivaceus]|uniref:hypothetical protein n=1 Tax=Streptomyces phaeolivaceus TaxID=2653200 RepID=UPI001D057B64|nr:hypothetical protein [Streptomyces phaeolivaceus]